MRIILDENLPRGLLRVLAPRQVTTVQQAGFAGVKNGELLAALDGVYDVFLTGDKKLRYQQNLTGRRLAIVELPTNCWPALRPLCPRIVETVDQCEAASYTVISVDCGKGDVPVVPRLEHGDEEELKEGSTFSLVAGPLCPVRENRF